MPSAASSQPCARHCRAASSMGSNGSGAVMATNPLTFRVFWPIVAGGSDVAPVLAARFEERVADLPERAFLYCVHQGGEDVVSADRGLLQPGDRGRRGFRVPGMEVGEPLELGLLLLLGGTGELHWPGRGLFAVRVEERVDANDGRS